MTSKKMTYQHVWPWSAQPQPHGGNYVLIDHFVEVRKDMRLCDECHEKREKQKENETHYPNLFEEIWL